MYFVDSDNVEVCERIFFDLIPKVGGKVNYVTILHTFSTFLVIPQSNDILY